MKISDGIVAGKNLIGYVNSTFTETFGNEEIVEKKVGTFQTLKKRMTDYEIESELKPGICDASDILAFIKNPPEGCKDGYWNLFYTPSFVVRVGWSGSDWGVYAWGRGAYGWGGGRVFSPATVNLGNSDTLESSGTLTLESRIKELENKVDFIMKNNLLAEYNQSMAKTPNY